MEVSGTTHRWVAGRVDARAATRALFAQVLRQPGIRVALGGAILLWIVVTEAQGENLATAVVWGVVFAVALVGLVLGLLYLVNRRRFARQLAPGLVLESEFGDDVVVLRAPHAESRLEFAGLDLVRRSREWVLIRQRRSRLVSCWPAALFPPEELARVEAAVVGRRDA